MTIIGGVRDRPAPVAAHIYTLPIARELPSQPPDAARDLHRHRPSQSTWRGCPTRNRSEPDVMSHLSYRLAQALTDDQLQVARANHRPAASAEPVKRLASGRDDHERQRALVRASLLVSRRQDAPTHRRWA